MNTSKSKLESTFLSDLASFTSTKQSETNYLTHGIHPYPAKFIPQIPKRIIQECVNERHTILDPFCGSGTTLLEASLQGVRSIGVDLNPIATLISTVKCQYIAKDEWEIIDKTFKSIEKRFKNKDFNNLWAPEIPRINHWFNKNAILGLSIIATELMKCENTISRHFLEVVFSSIIVQVSNQESDTRYAAKPNNITLDKIFTLFKSKYLKNRSSHLNLLKTIKERKLHKVHLQDSRKLSQFIDEKVDLVITSPPYLNSYDYYLYHKFRLFWLSYDESRYSVKTIQEKELGSRYKYSGKSSLPTSTFKQRMIEVFVEIRKVTKPNKLILFLVGDSIVDGEFINMRDFYKDLATQAGMKFVDAVSYPMSKITKSFVSHQNGHELRETKMQHILIFENISMRKTDKNEINEEPEIDDNLLNVRKIPPYVKKDTKLRIQNNDVAYTTHGIIKYPSKFIPQIPNWAIERYSNSKDIIFDPFVGCGTTLLEAKLLERYSLGIDINPFATLVSNIKCNVYDISTLQNKFSDIILDYNQQKKVIVPKFIKRDFWFDFQALEQIYKIKSAIYEETQDEIQDFFKVVLSTIIKKSSYLDESQIKVKRSQIKLVNGVKPPINTFKENFEKIITCFKDLSEKTNNSYWAIASPGNSSSLPESISWHNKLQKLKNVDMIVTSPPYINAINYPMFTRYELIILDLINDANRIKHQQEYIGSERVYSEQYSKLTELPFPSAYFKDVNDKIRKIYAGEPKRAFITSNYFIEMKKSLEQMYNILKPNHKMVIVVGTNEIKNIKLDTFDIVNKIAENVGFNLVNQFSYKIQHHRFKITRHETAKKINYDYITVFEK